MSTGIDGSMYLGVWPGQLLKRHNGLEASAVKECQSVAGTAGRRMMDRTA